MNLSNVSRTAIFTLIIHDIMAKKKIINDSLAVICLENMIQLATEEEKKLIMKMKKSLTGLGYLDAVIPHIKRVKYLDLIANNYISNNTGCTVINLACGFDTRYWRIYNKNCKFIEIDFPEVVTLKRELLKENISYEMIGCSVLDYSWIDKVTANGNNKFLIIAEGLLMYFSENDGINLLSTLSQKFSNSQLAFDMFQKFLTKGIWKRISDWYSNKFLGFKISMDFGFSKPNEIESINSGFKLIETKKIESRMIIHASIN
jgi:O-methyltransferase involved in polyketide biosynthesis